MIKQFNNLIVSSWTFHTDKLLPEFYSVLYVDELTAVGFGLLISEVRFQLTFFLSFTTCAHCDVWFVLRHQLISDRFT